MAAKKMTFDFEFVVVGGGIAAVSCVEYLACLDKDSKICVISSTHLVKTVSNVRKVGQTLEEFDVVEKPLESLSSNCFQTHVNVIRSTVVRFDPASHKVITSDNQEYSYNKLCICSGARPKLIAQENQHILGLRDLQSLDYFQKRLDAARRVVIVGNGGIALELAYELDGCQVIWVVKDDSIGNAYFDKGAAQFFLQNLKLIDSDISDDNIPHGTNEATQDFVEKNFNTEMSEYAGAVGRAWKEDLKMGRNSEKRDRNVCLEYTAEVEAILTPQEYGNLGQNSAVSHKKSMEWNVYVELTNGKTYGCDFVVSATGVIPNTESFIKHAKFDVASDGGLKVDDHMRTNICDVYAAGDVCSASWEHSKYWMQMRLWTQARQMGAYAAKCMVADVNGDDIFMDFCFELFTHVTRFFGYKVILLGKFNGQDLGKDYQVLLRCTKGEEYVKVIVYQGKVCGALLIGDTDLEETLENLILNEIDVSAFGEHLLDPDIDIDDYFD